MTKKARILGETSALNQMERFGSDGRTLGSYLDEANGLELPFDDPFGGKHVVSLAPFAGEDPNRYLMLCVAVAKEGQDFAPIYSDAVILKEYDLPPDIQEPEITPPDLGDSSFLKEYELPPGVKMLGN